MDDKIIEKRPRTTWNKPYRHATRFLVKGGQMANISRSANIFFAPP